MQPITWFVVNVLLIILLYQGEQYFVGGVILGMAILFWLKVGRFLIQEANKNLDEKERKDGF